MITTTYQSSAASTAAAAANARPLNRPSVASIAACGADGIGRGSRVVRAGVGDPDVARSLELCAGVSPGRLAPQLRQSTENSRFAQPQFGHFQSVIARPSVIATPQLRVTARP